jgi:uncharacterized protein with HEPN domain
MPRDYRLQLDDILTAVARIRAYVHGMSYDAFCADVRTQDAVVRNLEVIGEAARVLSEEVRARAPGVAWQKWVGLRNVLVHEYFGISLPIVWDIAMHKLDDLEDSCRSILEGSS